jgi:hypothetical protein
MKSGPLSVKEGTILAKPIKRLSDHLVNHVGNVRFLLTDRSRDSLSYYHIKAIRPHKKGELFLDGSNHIVNKADRDGDPHWIEIILRRCTMDTCDCGG